MKVFLALILIGLSWLWCPSGWARMVVPFEGALDWQQGQLVLLIGEGDTDAVALNFQRTAVDAVSFEIDLRHVKLWALDLASVVQGQIKFSGPGPRGELRSLYTLLNYKPVGDLHLKFAVYDGKLFIDRFWVGALSGSGQIGLGGEHDANLGFEIVSSDLEHVCVLFQNVETAHAPLVTGTLTGTVNVTGPFFDPSLKGRLAAYNGCFNALCYESILLQLDGNWANVRLDGSVVTHADGFSFNLAGGIDLRDVAHLPYQVRQLKKVPVVSAATNKREWILKRQRSDMKRDAVTEMKYIWIKDDRGDTESVLGFEHKIGF